MIHVQCVEIKKDPKGLVTVVGATDLGVTSEQQLLTAIEQVSSCVAHHVT
jgi:predicted ThiF/HesA family dinucleotide-utilizing enzyme